MAEIPIEKKSSMGWLWLVLALFIVALLAWWLLSEADDDDMVSDTDTVAVAGDTDSDENDLNGNGLADGMNGDANAVTLAAILANPETYIGRDDVSTNVTVGDNLTDRGFWITNGDARMFALVIDTPNDFTIDINPGQRLSITNAMVRDASVTDDLPGRPLDQDTMNILDDEPVFMLVDESDIEITSRP